MSIEQIREWQAKQRAQGRARLLADGLPLETIERLLGEAESMHEAQAECAARLLGLAPAVMGH